MLLNLLAEQKHAYVLSSIFLLQSSSKDSNVFKMARRLRLI